MEGNIRGINLMTLKQTARTVLLKIRERPVDFNGKLKILNREYHLLAVRFHRMPLLVRMHRNIILNGNT
jgi:hypothetical protein